MSHRVIIDSVVQTEPAGLVQSELSTAEYSFTFTPSHALTEQEEMKRIKKIRNTLKKLAEEVTASGESGD